MTTAAPAILPVPRRRHFYPVATTGRPHPLWYFGWAAYVNRYGYLRALAVGLPVTGGLAAAGVVFRLVPLLAAAGALAAGGLAVFAFSLLGIFRMYGPPAVRTLRRLLKMGGVDGPVAKLRGK